MVLHVQRILGTDVFTGDWKVEVDITIRSETIVRLDFVATPMLKVFCSNLSVMSHTIPEHSYSSFDFLLFRHRSWCYHSGESLGCMQVNVWSQIFVTTRATFWRVGEPDFGVHFGPPFGHHLGFTVCFVIGASKRGGSFWPPISGSEIFQIRARLVKQVGAQIWSHDAL